MGLRSLSTLFNARPSEEEVCVRIGVVPAILLAASCASAAAPPLTIEQLLNDGWEIAGYTSGYDIRSSLTPLPAQGQALSRSMLDSL